MSKEIYKTNARVWSRRMEVVYNEERAEKAWEVLEKKGVSESVKPVLFAFSLSFETNTEETYKICLVAARALVEILRGNSDSGRDSVSAFAKWVRTQRESQELSELVVFAVKHREAINDMVAKVIHVRNEGYRNPSLANLILGKIKR